MNNELFEGIIEFENKEKLSEFINNLDKSTALKIIEIGLELSLKKGIYNLDEAYCLYKSLEVIKNEK